MVLLERVFAPWETGCQLLFSVVADFSSISSDASSWALTLNFLNKAFYFFLGVGRLRGGVYCFDKFSPSTAQVNAVGSHNLWHGRLGHPSDQVFSLLSKDINISGSIENNVEGPCDICFRAKQTRTQFVASESHALFQLIHCDIWGAYRVPSLCGAQYF